MTRFNLTTAILIAAPVLAYLAGVVIAAPEVDLRQMLASPVDLTVYSPDQKLVIGHSQYNIKQADRTVEIVGNTHYTNGERDWERIMLGYEPGNPLPIVRLFQANFFASDNAPELVVKADFASGHSSCRWHSQFEDNTYEDKLQFEPDTYAGAA